MTRDDCYKSLLNTKVFVKDRSASIQCILFSLGFEWNGGRSCSSLVRRTDAPFLFISEDGKITCSNSTDHFYSMNNKEVSAEYILSMKYIDEELSVSYLSPWISVNEKLPPQQEPIIIAMKNKNKEDGIWLYDLCKFFGGDYTDNNNWEEKVNWEKPIYWTPIPNLSKEKQIKIMTREEAKDLLPIIQAFAEGKVIQCKSSINNEWRDFKEPIFNGLPDNYRIKPEPKYRSFKTQEEYWQEMLKHQPFWWVKNKCGNIFNIIAIFKDSIKLNECNTYYSERYKQFKFIDGTPFGIKE